MASPSNPSRDGLKQIKLNGRSLQEVRDELLDAFRVKACDGLPLLYQSGGRLVRIREVEDSLQIQTLDANMLRSLMDQVAIFVRQYGKKKAYQVLPQNDFVFDFLSQPSWPSDAVPYLDGVMRCPIFAADGSIISKAGFHEHARLFFKPSPRLVIDEIPAVPSETEVSAAIVTIDDMLHDFPFEDLSSKANAIALLLTPFCRKIVTSLVPMCVVEASTPGTGKGLFINAVTTVFIGAPCCTSAPPREEEEWRKSITSHLLNNPAFILYDNIAGVLHSRSLEQVLTATEWTDRALGTNDLATSSNRAIWLATGNNLDVRGDLPRRLFWIRLDAKMERPDERSPEAFRHPDLLGWIAENRSQLVRSCLMLIQNWIAKGRPKGTRPIGVGSFQSWAETLGGILFAAGIEGFLDNAREKRATADDDNTQGYELCRRWYNKYDTEEVGTKDLFDLVQEFELFPHVWAGDKPKGQHLRLGHQLKKFKGRIFGPYRINQVSKDNSRRLRYCLEIINPNHPHLSTSDDDAPQDDPSPMDFDPLLDEPSVDDTDDEDELEA